MPSRGKTSAFHPGPRSDLESHGFAPEFIPTAAEQRLMLFTHVIKAFGITIALMINAIFFVPFFVFGILPVLIKERLGKISTSVYPPLAPTSPSGKKGRARGIFFSHDHQRTESPNGDVSPLLLSADSSISDFAPYGDRPTILSGVREDFPPLPGPMIEFPSVLGGYATYDGPAVQVTQPHIPGTNCIYNGNPESYAQLDNTAEYTSEDEGLLMKGTYSVDLLKGTPRHGGCLASGLKVPSHGQSVSGNMVMKREKTWENLQEAVYPTSKLL
jgi:hypothetical protein